MSNYTIQLIGNIGSDPEIKETANGRMMMRASLATTESFIRQDTGEKVNRTHWHNLIAWGPQADYAKNYLKKGTYVGVRGKLVTRTVDVSNGTKRTHTEILVKEFLNLKPLKPREEEE